VIIVQNLLEVCRELVAQGQTIIIVEQNVRAALSLASRAYVLNNGHVVRRRLRSAGIFAGRDEPLSRRLR
jgi:ABC-type branched-subunit amino acid transport system ATPase component